MFPATPFGYGAAFALPTKVLPYQEMTCELVLKLAVPDPVYWTRSAYTTPSVGLAKAPVQLPERMTYWFAPLFQLTEKLEPLLWLPM